jgi:hypothetical protein
LFYPFNKNILLLLLPLRSNEWVDPNMVLEQSEFMFYFEFFLKFVNAPKCVFIMIIKLCKKLTKIELHEYYKWCGTDLISLHDCFLNKVGFLNTKIDDFLII